MNWYYIVTGLVLIIGSSYGIGYLHCDCRHQAWESHDFSEERPH